MQSAKLDRRLTLQRFTSSQDPGSGENIETWSDLATVWANYKPVSDGEKMQAGEVSATLAARFTIRYDSAWADLSAVDRVVFEGRTFDIFGTKEVDGRRQFLEITTSARSE